MNDVYIKDANILLEQVNNISQHIQNFYYVQDSLNNICTEIKQAWTSDTIDRESFFQNVTDSTNKLSNLVLALQKLNVHLKNYAYEQIQNTRY